MNAFERVAALLYPRITRHLSAGCRLEYRFGTGQIDLMRGDDIIKTYWPTREESPNDEAVSD